MVGWAPGGILVMKYLLKLPHLHRTLFKQYFMLFVATCDRRHIHIDLANHCTIKDGDIKRDKIPELPEPPTNCCFSGCANCVWIKYAEDLSEIFGDAEDKVKEIILKKIDDPNMKAFLLMELKCAKFKK